MKIANQLFLLITAIFTFSCSTDEFSQQINELLSQQLVEPKITYHSINRTVAPNQNLYTFITSSGVNVVITKQASNYSISEFITDEQSGSVIYNYKPKEDYYGNDYVEIKETNTSFTTVYRISITVTSD